MTLALHDLPKIGVLSGLQEASVSSSESSSLGITFCHVGYWLMSTCDCLNFPSVYRSLSPMCHKPRLDPCVLVHLPTARGASGSHLPRDLSLSSVFRLSTNFYNAIHELSVFSDRIWCQGKIRARVFNMSSATVTSIRRLLEQSELWITLVQRNTPHDMMYKLMRFNEMCYNIT